MPTEDVTPTPAAAGPAQEATPTDGPGATQDADSTRSPQHDLPARLPAVGQAHQQAGETAPLTLELLQAEVAELKTLHEREKSGRAGALRALEAERRRADQALAIAQGAQRQPVYQPGPPPSPEYQIDESGLSPAESRALNDAIISGDNRTQRDIERARGARLRSAAAYDTESRIYQNLASAADLGQRNQAFLQYFHGNKLGDPSDPKAQRVAAAYNALMRDPSTSFVDRTPFDLGGGVVVVPNILRLAVAEVEKETGTARATAREEARQSPEGFVEPARKGNGQMPGDAKAKGFSVKLLSEEERAVIDDTKRRDPTYTAERYFKNLPPGNQAERLAAGKPMPLPRRSRMSM